MISEPASADPMSPAGRKLDEGIEAVSELFELARAVFESAFAGWCPSLISRVILS